MEVPRLLILCLLTSASSAHLKSASFPGYGFAWYNPVCGYACHDAISAAPLSCTPMESMHGHSGMSMSTPPECYAIDEPFLTTLAYCMNATCGSELAIWQREKYWAEKVTGDPNVLPKWDYSETLERVTKVPTETFDPMSEGVLKSTLLVDKVTYETQSRFMVMFDHIEALQPQYIFALLAVGFGTPIFFTLLTHLPILGGVIERVKPYLIYPCAIGNLNLSSWSSLLGNSPTIGQALYIVVFIILNIVLSAVNYSSSQPHPWGLSLSEETLAYVGYRTGHIAFALLPLLILFSGRNNFLLWITNWPYSTYILLHRWIARVFAIQAIVHSIALLLSDKSSGSYDMESKMAYWLWGIVATVLTCGMLVLSHIYFRRRAYEIFLILHILLTALVIVGCWYHIVLKWGYNFYMNWLYAACAVWFFDRLFRALRVAKNGIRRAKVTEIGRDYVRVDVQGVRWASKPGHVAYAYFPTLNPLRPWENHPFSINSTGLFSSYKHAIAPVATSPASSLSPGNGDIEKSTAGISEAKEVIDLNTTKCETGVTFIIKKHGGITSLLQSHERVITLIDGPYPHNPSAGILACDHVLLIGGGIGITGILAWVHAHPNVKLAWSVKESAHSLVQEMGIVLGDVTDKEILIGGRLDIKALLKVEAKAGYAKVGVVVCGPRGMCEDVRAVVAGLGRRGQTRFELEVDAFSW